MKSSEPTPTPSSSIADSASPGHGKSAAVQFWAIGAGVVAALGSWLLIEGTLNSFKPTPRPRQFMNSTFMLVQSEDRSAAEVRSADLAIGLMGATVGLAMGLAGGLARRSARAALAAALLGLALGAAAGEAAALSALPLASRVHERDPGNMSGEMAASLIAHGATWGAVGAAGGLAFGIGLGGWGRAVRTLIGGLIGGVAGAFLFELIGALAMPDVKILQPIASSWDVRLIAQASAVITAAAGVAALVSFPTRRRSAPTPANP